MMLSCLNISKRMSALFKPKVLVLLYLNSQRFPPLKKKTLNMTWCASQKTWIDERLNPPSDNIYILFFHMKATIQGFIKHPQIYEHEAVKPLGASKRESE